MRNFILVIVFGAAIWLWQHDKLSFSTPVKAFDNAGKPIVLVYTYDGCGSPCETIVQELKKRKVPFQETVVDPNDNESDEYKQWIKMNENGFPLTMAGNERAVGSSKAHLASLLANNFNSLYLTKAEKHYFKVHFYEDGSPRVVMYGVDWCPYCAKLRDEFKKEGMDYVEIDVEKSSEKEQMSQTMEISGYPATWVGYTRVKGSTLNDVKAAMH